MIQQNDLNPVQKDKRTILKTIKHGQLSFDFKIVNSLNNLTNPNIHKKEEDGNPSGTNQKTEH